MSVTRGMGAAVWCGLRGQYQEASGEELLRDGNFAEVGTAAWASIVGAPISKQTTNPFPGTTQVLRVGAVGAYGAARPAVNVTVVGRTYRARGYMRGDGAGVATVQIRDGGGPLLATSTNLNVWQWCDVTYVATTTNIDLGVTGASGYVEFAMWSLQEVVQKTADDGDYCAAETYLLSNRSGAQECASLSKLETVDRHTGAVTTVADFTTSPGAGAVITPPAGWTYACASAGRTTQTSVSTLVTGLAANAAPWRDAGGGKGLAVESERTQYIYQSRILNGLGWTNSGTCVVTPNADAGPSGDGQACQVAFSAAFDSVNRAGTAYAGNCVISAWRKQGTGTKSNFYVTDGGAHGPSLNNLTAAWARYDFAYLNAAAGTAYYVDAAWAATPADLGTRFDDFTQVERGLYPSSAIWSTNLLVTRSAATLTVPLDVCNTLSGKIPRVTWVPHFAYNESLLDATIVDDSRGTIFYEQATQKFVYEVRGRGRIASLACTFSREQSIVVRGDMDEASGLLTLIVSGATSGNGTFQTYAAPKKALVCGDGFTAATFPTQLGPSVSVRKGMNFNGLAASNQRLVASDQLLGTGDITVVLQSIQRSAGFALWARLVSNAVASGFDISLVFDGVNYHFYVTSNAFTTIFDTIFDPYMRTAATIIVTRTAGVTGTCLYVNGKLISTGNSGVAQIGDGNLTIGSYPNAGIAQRPMDAELFHASIWPFAFTPQQVSVMHQRLLAELST